MITEVLLYGATIILLVPTLVFFAEVVASLTRPHSAFMPEVRRPRIAIVVPAHNEAVMIGRTISSLVPQLNVGDRVIVIADNCADETAAIAASEGAEVIVRNDELRRGKGYALDCGVRHLETDPPEVVIVVDADCQVASGAIARLARVCGGAQRPIQALYIMRAPANSTASLRLSEFAWIVKNQVRPSGLNRLGLPCQLMGTGMAFPWQTICAASLATGHLAEDLNLGIELARRGSAPLFCAEALVTSVFPSSVAGARSQRTRWEHGYLSVVLKETPRLFIQSLFTLDKNLLALALDLLVPPLALLSLLIGVAGVATCIFFALTGRATAFELVMLMMSLLTIAVMMAWRNYAKEVIRPKDLAYAVVFGIRKIPLYVKFLISRESTWVRTKRDDD